MTLDSFVLPSQLVRTTNSWVARRLLRQARRLSSEKWFLSYCSLRTRFVRQQQCHRLFNRSNRIAARLYRRQCLSLHRAYLTGLTCLKAIPAKDMRSTNRHRMIHSKGRFSRCPINSLLSSMRSLQFCRELKQMAICRRLYVRVTGRLGEMRCHGFCFQLHR